MDDTEIKFPKRFKVDINSRQFARWSRFQHEIGATDQAEKGITVRQVT